MYLVFLSHLIAIVYASMKYDYIVIGGGVIGMTTSREIAARGASIAIIDRQNFGNGASKVAGGILSSMRPWDENIDSHKLSEESKKNYSEFIFKLQEESGINVEFIKSGLIIMNEEHSEKTKKWAINNDIKLTQEIDNNYPEINIPSYSILLPEIYQIRPPLLLNALHKSLQKKSVDMFENSNISNIEIIDNKFRCITLDSGEKIYADNLIITAGAWTDLLLKKIKTSANIKPIRGQMLCVKLKNLTINSIILDEGNYLIPRLDGHVLVGSTMEDVGFMNKTTQIAKDELLNWMYSIIANKKKIDVLDHWSGLRPAVDIGKPVIGNIPDFENIFINTGHFRKGILQAPASAQLLADYLFKNTSFMDIDRFSLGTIEKI